MSASPSTAQVAAAYAVLRHLGVSRWRTETLLKRALGARGRLLCAVGLHRWKGAIHVALWTPSTGRTESYRVRHCRRCGHMEARS